LKIEPTYLEGCFILKPEVFKDERGIFFENYNKKVFSELSHSTTEFVQENQSISKKGVLRGFHFQKGKNVQAKLVRIVKGQVQDVVVDLRKESKTFGTHFSVILDDINNYQLYIPKGFAHAFLCLTEEVIFSYKCDAYYNAASEAGIIYNDKTLNIQWKLPDETIILSEKDKHLPAFNELFP
jgi:dTDP-4-dehydrorhamnose 3,5-epimerase